MVFTDRPVMSTMATVRPVMYLVIPLLGELTALPQTL